MRVITVVGETLVDIIEEAPGRSVAHAGGSPANVAVALARLGQPVSLLTQLGDDPYGRKLRDHLTDNHVHLAPGSLVDRPRTSTARTSLSPDGQASFDFDITWHRFATQVPSWPDPAVTCVHTGSVAAMLAPGADDVLALVRAARDTSMISFDPNCRPSLTRDPALVRDRVAAFVATCDIVKASIDDLAWLYPGQPYREVAREWLTHGPGLVVVTMGASGVWARTPSRERSLPASPVTVVDTVGAGDAFAAGLLTGLHRANLLGATRRAALHEIDDATLDGVLSFASRVAAATCGRRGADPPTLDELLQRGSA